jgi:hypothetical protein
MDVVGARSLCLEVLLESADQFGNQSLRQGRLIERTDQLLTILLKFGRILWRLHRPFSSCFQIGEDLKRLGPTSWIALRNAGTTIIGFVDRLRPTLTDNPGVSVLRTS